MNDSGLTSVALLLRILAVWWIVKWFATHQYRSNQFTANISTPESDPAVRVHLRHEARQRTTRLLLHWLAASLIVALSGLSVVSQRGTLHPESWFVFAFAVVIVNLVFFSAEWAAGGAFRSFLNLAGWLCAVVVAVAYTSQHGHPAVSLEKLTIIALLQNQVWVLAIGYFLATLPTGSAIGRFMGRWSDQLPPDQGLPGAGQWIGYCERFLIVSCLIANQPAGVAILVTAKGILRFGEIHHETDTGKRRKLVEYILVGTMLSYAAALSIGWIMRLLL